MVLKLSNHTYFNVHRFMVMNYLKYKIMCVLAQRVFIYCTFVEFVSWNKCY